MSQQSVNRTVTHSSLSGLSIALLIVLAIGCNQRSSLTTASNQVTNQVDTDEETFTVVEVPPMFPGGNAQISSYLRKNVHYPEEAIRAKAEGKVFVSFVVNKFGAIQDVQVLKGLGHGLDEEAKRLVESMPNWIPGRQANRPVRVKYNLVVPFDLASAK